VNNRQPKASGATMDEFETDGHPADGEAGVLPVAGFHETSYETSGTADFPVDYDHTGHRRVDDALDRLALLPDTPLSGHADVYDAVHNDLRAVLAEQPAGAQGAQGAR
jgi:hypothetical protein